MTSCAAVRTPTRSQDFGDPEGCATVDGCHPMPAKWECPVQLSTKGIDPGAHVLQAVTGDRAAALQPWAVGHASRDAGTVQ